MARFSYIALVFILVVCIIPTLAYGQSACQQLGVDCTFHPSGGSNSGSHGSSNSGPSEHQQQREQKYEEWQAHRAQADQWYGKGNTALNAYLQDKTTASFQEALEDFKQAISNEDSYGPAWTGAVHLLASAEDHEGALKWAMAGSGRAKFAPEARGRMHAWFHLVIKQQNLALEQIKYNHDCDVTYGRDRGGNVDLTGPSLGTTLANCKKAQGKLNNSNKEVSAESDRYNAKYFK